MRLPVALESGGARRSSLEETTMPVTIMLYLFGKPGVELREGEDVTPEELRALGDDLKERLTSAAEIVEKLTGAGWDAQMTLYDILLSHPYIDTEPQAAEK